MMHPKKAVLISCIFITIFLIGPSSLRPSNDGIDGNYRSSKLEEIAALRRTESERVKSFMNTSVNPCDDFYEYACGNFVNALEDFDNDSVSVFSEVMKKINFQTLLLLSNFSNDNLIENKVKIIYETCLNSSLLKNLYDSVIYLEELGSFPLLKTNWSETSYNFDWMNFAAQVHLLGANSIIMEEIGRSPYRNENVLYIGPEEPMDVSYDDLISSNQLIYDSFVSKRKLVFLTITADEEAARKAAEELFHFEAGRVKIFGKDYLHLEHDYREIDYGEFREEFPENDWDGFFEILLGYPIKDSQKIVIRYSEFLRPLIDYVTKVDKAVLANFMLYEILSTTLVSYLSEEPSDESCIEEIEQSLHYILTAKFVRRFYNEDNRNHLEEITRYINESARILIRNSKWLDLNSRAEAERKLNKMRLLNGYIDELIQDSWLEEHFADLEVRTDSFIKNIISLRQHNTRMKAKTLLKTPSDLAKYNLNFYNFNFFYYFGVNVLVAPLGFQNLPVYHPYLPKSYNFGSLGSFLGHEMTHALDTSGRKFDADGNVRNWWSQKSDKEFMKAAECFVNVFNNYTISKEIGTYVDGRITLPENIADHGGVKESYYAYKKWFRENHNRPFSLTRSETLPGLGLSNLQLFFLSYAQFWCGYIKPSDYASVLRTDHSPGKFRVLGVLSNFGEFSKVFKCPSGSPMNPVKKCSVW